MVLFGCTSPSVKNSKRKKIGEVFSSVGISQYFLGPVPKWANFSTSGSCFIKNPVRYVDLPKLQHSFNLSYQQSIQFQSVYHKLLRSSTTKAGMHYLSLKEEELLFYNAVEKVESRLDGFMAPTYKKVHIYWIDSIWNWKATKLRRFLERGSNVGGHPVFLSLCHDSVEVEKFLVVKKIDDLNIRVIGNDMFTPFDFKGNRIPGFYLKLDTFFNKKQKLVFYSSGGEFPFEVGGIESIKKIK
jgi:hypothetical protein